MARVSDFLLDQLNEQVLKCKSALSPEDYAFLGCGKLTGVVSPESASSIQYQPEGHVLRCPAKIPLTPLKMAHSLPAGMTAARDSVVSQALAGEGRETAAEGKWFVTTH